MEFVDRGLVSRNLLSKRIEVYAAVVRFGIGLELVPEGLHADAFGFVGYVFSPLPPGVHPHLDSPVAAVAELVGLDQRVTLVRKVAFVDAAVAAGRTLRRLSGQLDVDDVAEMLAAERIEEQRFVDAVEELGAERVAQLVLDRGIVLVPLRAVTSVRDRRGAAGLGRVDPA